MMFTRQECGWDIVNTGPLLHVPGLQVDGLAADASLTFRYTGSGTVIHWQLSVHVHIEFWKKYEILLEDGNITWKNINVNQDSMFLLTQ